MSKKPKSIDLTRLRENMDRASKMVGKIESGKSKKKGTEDLEEVVSIYEANLPQLIKSIESGNDDENTVILILRTSLGAVIRMMPLAEKAFLKYKNERAAYCFIALQGLLENTANSLKARSDRGALVGKILEVVIEPQFTLQAQQCTVGVRQIRKSAGARFKGENLRWIQRKCDELIDSQLRLIQDSRDQTAIKLRELLTE